MKEGTATPAATPATPTPRSNEDKTREAGNMVHHLSLREVNPQYPGLVSVVPCGGNEANVRRGGRSREVTRFRRVAEGAWGAVVYFGGVSRTPADSCCIRALCSVPASGPRVSGLRPIVALARHLY